MFKVLLFLLFNYFSVSTLNLGTVKTPKLSNILLQIKNKYPICRQTIIFNNLPIESLQNTNNVPITIKKITNIGLSFKNIGKRTIRNNHIKNHIRLLINNKGLKCENIIFLLDVNLFFFDKKFAEISNDFLDILTLSQIENDGKFGTPYLSPDKTNIFIIPNCNKKIFLKKLTESKTNFFKRINNHFSNDYATEYLLLVIFLPNVDSNLKKLGNSFCYFPLEGDSRFGFFKCQNKIIKLPQLHNKMDLCWSFQNLKLFSMRKIRYEDDSLKLGFDDKYKFYKLVKLIYLHINGSGSCVKNHYSFKGFFSDLLPFDSKRYKYEARFTSILIETQGYGFLTCHQVKKLDFSIYYSPFKKELWGCILLSIISLTIVTDIFLRFKLKLVNKYSIFIYISSIIDESPIIPKLLEKTQFFRILTSLWFLIAGFLSSICISKLIEKFNSNLDTKKYETFDQILCKNNIQYLKPNFISENISYLEIYYIVKELNISLSGPGLIWTHDYYKKINNINTKCFSLLSDPIAENTEGMYIDSGMAYNFYSKLVNILKKHYNFITILSNHTQNLIHNLMHPRHRKFPEKFNNKSYNNLHYSSNYYSNFNYFKYNEISSNIESEIVKCGKSVWVDKVSRVNENFEYLRKKYPIIKFYKSSSSIFPEREELTFPTAVSKLPYYFRNFVEQGIYQKNSKESEKTRIFLRLNKTKKIIKKLWKTEMLSKANFKRISLKGNVQTLFIIYGILIITAIVSILFELYKFIWHQLIFFKNFIRYRFFVFSAYLYTIYWNFYNIKQFNMYKN